mmetsp:Transcript_14588/g.21463  ORF Transcript_14588/g.21463 Transcript_14588/m.21463 type:complete len:358 (+) Transcript_14588:181-1254(+)
MAATAAGCMERTSTYNPSSCRRGTCQCGRGEQRGVHAGAVCSAAGMGAHRGVSGPKRGGHQPGEQEGCHPAVCGLLEGPRGRGAPDHDLLQSGRERAPGRRHDPAADGLPPGPLCGGAGAAAAPRGGRQPGHPGRAHPALPRLPAGPPRRGRPAAQPGQRGHAAVHAGEAPGAPACSGSRRTRPRGAHPPAAGGRPQHQRRRRLSPASRGVSGGPGQGGAEPDWPPPHRCEPERVEREHRAAHCCRRGEHQHCADAAGHGGQAALAQPVRAHAARHRGQVRSRGRAARVAELGRRPQRQARGAPGPRHGGEEGPVDQHARLHHQRPGTGPGPGPGPDLLLLLLGHHRRPGGAHQYRA